MSVKCSSWEHCIIPACELLVFWLSIKINKGWKMTSSYWLCANFVTQKRDTSQSLSAPVKPAPAAVLGHVLEIHLSSKLNYDFFFFLGICFLSPRFLSCWSSLPRTEKVVWVQHRVTASGVYRVVDALLPHHIYAASRTETLCWSAWAHVCVVTAEAFRK